MSTVQYLGHAGSGGLQRHSIGDQYPYTIVGTQHNAWAPTKWYVLHLHTNQRGIRRHTYKEAEIDLYSLRIRNMMHG